MSLVEQLAVFIGMDEKTVRDNLIKLTLTDVVKLTQFMHDKNKEAAFKIISGAAV